MTKKNVLCVLLAVSLISMCMFYKHLQHETMKTTNSQNMADSLDTTEMWNDLEESFHLKESSCNLDQDQLKRRHPEYLPDDLREADQEDQRLIKHIKECWLKPPCDKPRKLQSSNGTDYSQFGQGLFLEEYFAKKKTPGFYVECGAYDGEYLSNTLGLEIHQNWNGLLIEANHYLYQRLVAKQRKAYMLNACLSPTTKPVMMDFVLAGDRSGLLQSWIALDKQNVTRQVKVQCLPMYSILAALRAIGYSHIDLFSLDVEGAEVSILETLPLDKVDIGSFLVETKVNQDKHGTARRRRMVESILSKGGYKVVDTPFNIDMFMVKE